MVPFGVECEEDECSCRDPEAEENKNGLSPTAPEEIFSPLATWEILGEDVKVNSCVLTLTAIGIHAGPFILEYFHEIHEIKGFMLVDNLAELLKVQVET